MNVKVEKQKPQRVQIFEALVDLLKAKQPSDSVHNFRFDMYALAASAGMSDQEVNNFMTRNPKFFVKSGNKTKANSNPYFTFDDGYSTVGEVLSRIKASIPNRLNIISSLDHKPITQKR